MDYLQLYVRSIKCSRRLADSPNMSQPEMRPRSVAHQIRFPFQNIETVGSLLRVLDVQLARFIVAYRLIRLGREHH
jgi:hypothetical protein